MDVIKLPRHCTVFYLFVGPKLNSFLDSFSAKEGLRTKTLIGHFLIVTVIMNTKISNSTWFSVSCVDKITEMETFFQTICHFHNF